MIKTSILRYASIGMATLGFAGIAAASTVNFDTTGSGSNNQATLNNSNTQTRTNTNAVGLSNLNFQGAATGAVNASTNTLVSGGLASGAASNSSITKTDVVISNAGSGAAASFFTPANDSVTYHLTGPNSNQQTTINNTNTSTTTNTNLLQLTNVNAQGAVSGSVNANNNTTVGGLTSGSASNSSTTSTSVSITN
jgi:trimeric autotransporter adhesin